MKHFRFLIFSSLLMLLLNGGSTRAQNTVSLTPDIITHITLLPESASAEGIKIAATWWLPDWQNAMSQRLSDNSQPDSGSDQNCARYGYIQECETPKVGSGIVRPLEGLTCYRSCTCPASYQYDDSNCSGMKQPAGDSCDGQYLECRCPETFIYKQTNCQDEYKLAGDTCDGLYDQCIPRPCSDGGYLEAEDQDKTCNQVTYGGRTCYACREKNCEEKCSAQGFMLNQECSKGQTKESCSSACGSYVKCIGEACPAGIGGSCEYGCSKYSTQNGCEDVCLECSLKPKGCENGTIESDSVWCSASAITDCAALGYKDASCSGHKIRCPFDTNQFSCFAN